ncbi:MAG: hypothetical protein E4H20_02045 [Spirochaetales bacterium]|nr:MAG: hypothetical protein E4H20_02045 [Spirochaetales bacterium]
MNRMFGAALLGMAAMAWLARDVPESKPLRAIVLAIFTYFTLGSISILVFGLQGIANVMVWFSLGFHLPIAIAFGYYFFARREMASP